MTRVTSGAGIVYPSMAPESIPVLVGSCCPICSVLCVILQPFLSCYSFYFFLFSVILQFAISDYPFGIFKLVVLVKTA